MPSPGHNSMHMDIDTMVDELENRGIVWADADAAAKALDEARKSVLAQCLLDSDGKTVGEREARALVHDIYRRHLDAMRGAIRAANVARVRYDSWKVRLELMRTQAATQRAAMGMR